MGIKYSVNESFFDTWSPQMAYVLGFWSADGSLENTPYNRGKYIRVTSTDKEIIVAIKQALQAEHPVVVLPNELKQRKTSYLLRIGSHALYDALASRGLYPNKSLTMSLPKIPKKYLKDFLRGYFDGDGCVFLEFGKGTKQQKIIKRLRTIFTSGSKIFLEQFSMKLSDTFNLSPGQLRESQRAYQLHYGTRESVLLFGYMYVNIFPSSLYLERKFARFAQYFILRPQRRSKKAARILNRVTWSSS